jgi:transposase
MSGHSAEERFVIVAEARRRRTRAEKDAIVAELSAGGATVSAVARKHNISPSLLFRWRRELSDKPAKRSSPSPRFLPVMVDAPGRGRGREASGPAVLSGGLIEIELSGGRRIRVDSSVDVAALRRVIDILELR